MRETSSQRSKTPSHLFYSATVIESQRPQDGLENEPGVFREQLEKIIGQALNI